MDHVAFLAPPDATANSIRDASASISDRASDAARDQDLIRRCRAGDPDAFDQLVSLHFATIRRLAWCILGDREWAEDAAQEIFIKAWRGIRRFNGSSSFATWLHSIGLRHCLDIVRKRRREAARFKPLTEDRTDERIFSFTDDSLSPSRWELRFAVQDALARLPEKLRIVLALHYCAGYSIREVAEELRLSPSAVHSRLRIALERMERLLKDTEE